MYAHDDPNNWWAIYKADTEEIDGVEYVKDGDLVRLLHLVTGKRLHTHDVRPTTSDEKYHFEARYFIFHSNALARYLTFVIVAMEIVNLQVTIMITGKLKSSRKITVMLLPLNDFVRVALDLDWCLPIITVLSFLTIKDFLAGVSINKK